MERGKPDERRKIIEKLTGNVVQMSQHKYASNVVEKCLEHGDSTERELLIEEIMGKSEEDDHLLVRTQVLKPHWTLTVTHFLILLRRR